MSPSHNMCTKQSSNKKVDTFIIITTISKVLQSYYQCYTESVLTFSSIPWFGGLSVKNKSKLNKVVNVSSKIVGRRLCSLSELYEQRTTVMIIGNTSHILAPQCEILQSGKHYHVQSKR